MKLDEAGNTIARMEVIPLITISGPIEASLMRTTNYGATCIPLITISGPIEAFCARVRRCCYPSIPLITISGPIEANCSNTIASFSASFR